LRPASLVEIAGNVTAKDIDVECVSLLAACALSGNPGQAIWK
jgi:hypothetical protein